MERYESPVERSIREAIERGDFDDLPGQGKPLDLSDAGDPDWWVKRLIKREGLDSPGSATGVMALRKERAGYPESLRDVVREADVREILEDYNRRVKADRLRPVSGRGMPVIAGLVDVDEMVAEWARLRSAQEVARSGAVTSDRTGGSGDSTDVCGRVAGRSGVLTRLSWANARRRR